MRTEFKEETFDEQILTCPNCHWKGKGSEAIVIDFYGVVADKEVTCPSCDRRLGILKKRKSPPGESASDLSFQTG